jgi:hypothetical protein
VREWFIFFMLLLINAMIGGNTLQRSFRKDSPQQPTLLICQNVVRRSRYDVSFIFEGPSALAHVAASGKCMISLFKSGPASAAFLQSNLFVDASSPKVAFHPGLFLDAEEDEEEDGPALLRTPTQDTLFAEKASKTFDSSCFDSRKACLRQVMKCVVAAERMKDPSQTIDSVHRLKGATVLEIVQVFHCFTMTSSGWVSQVCDLKFRLELIILIV